MRFASSTHAKCPCNRSMDDQHMTKASGPHVLCDAVNLMVDPKHMMAAPCLKHRPNYLCNFGTTYNRYLPGAFGMACTSAIRSLAEFPRDHLQDIMDSMARISPEIAAQVICISCLVTCLHMAQWVCMLYCFMLDPSRMSTNHMTSITPMPMQSICCVVYAQLGFRLLGCL